MKKALLAVPFLVLLPLTACSEKSQDQAAIQSIDTLCKYGTSLVTGEKTEKVARKAASFAADKFVNDDNKTVAELAHAVKEAADGSSKEQTAKARADIKRICTEQANSRR